MCSVVKNQNIMTLHKNCSHYRAPIQDPTGQSQYYVLRIIC